jgi:hypothetical protein
MAEIYYLLYTGDPHKISLALAKTINIVRNIKKYLHDYKNSHSFVSGLINAVIGSRKNKQQ